MNRPPDPSAHEEPFSLHLVLGCEHTMIAARRDKARAAFLTPGPTCYVKAVDRALRERDKSLARYFRAVDGGNAPLVPDGLAGLALSGGGVRSATFNLGVLQRLRELGILQKLDYLSTVSGGGYIGCSLAAYVTAAQQDAFPFPRSNEDAPHEGSSEVASPESFGLRHLRRFSSYLVGRGWADALAAALTGLGGVLGNVLILLPYLLLLAMLAIIQLCLLGASVSMVGATALFGVVLLTALLYAIAQARRRAMARPWADRERFGRRMALLGGFALAAALWLVQPPLLLLLRDMLGTLSWQGMAAAFTGGGVAAGILSAGRLVLASPLLRRPAIAALLLLVSLALLWLLFAALGLGLLGIEERIGFRWMIVASVGLAVLLFAIGRILPANFGSLHGFYRDRLSKAYFFKPHKLDANSLEQFDDCQLSSLDVGHLPYPLINACLNVSDASSREEDLTREYPRPGRRGTFFLFSRNAVGNDTLGYVSAKRFEADNGLDGSLATAMAISGAAFGANMGYKTNPAAVLLLTLLNVRTGRWVKFPPTNSSKPPLQRLLGDYAYLTLAREAIARFDGASGDLLLSDGGHVDNLGLYQLLQRRCSLIIACDAEADPAYAFEGLADAVRLAKIDLNVTVEIDYAHLAAIRDGKRHFAIGRIRYPDAPDGRLIYLKSSLTHEALRDVSLLHYHRSNSAFPHETTADQFFSEQQFEAYRSLGYCACSRTFEGPAAG